VDKVELAVYFDFTCGYSYRGWLWFERIRAAGTKLDIEWRPFLLKEVNRAEGEDPFLSGSKITSVAVLALALAEALDDGEPAEVFRSQLFQAMHERDQRPSKEEIIRIAAEVGLDQDAFWRDEASWLARVRDSHEQAVSGLGVFGTPTLVVDESHALYLKLEAVPRANDNVLLNAVLTVARDHLEVAELKRPSKSG
jgi:2-hydroxychromene-2-carboxylate isomerase